MSSKPPKPKQPKPSKSTSKPQASEEAEVTEVTDPGTTSFKNEDRFRELLHRRGLMLVGFVVSPIKVHVEISGYKSDLVVQLDLSKRELDSKSVEATAENVSILAWRAIKGG